MTIEVHTETYPVYSPQWRVRDGGRLVSFEGYKLSEATSERDDSTRWTEIEIYRTEDGRYVAHRVGVTTLVHNMDCRVIISKKLPRTWEIKPDEFQLKDRVPCDVCRPDIELAMKTDPASLVAETDRHWVSISETANAMIESLYTSRQGSRSLSSIASNAIMQAAGRDPEIAKAYGDVRI